MRPTRQITDKVNKRAGANKKTRVQSTGANKISGVNKKTGNNVSSAVRKTAGANQRT